MDKQKNNCPICAHNHNPDEDHIFFERDKDRDFEIMDAGAVKIDPEPRKKLETTKEPRKPKITRSESTMSWRKKNPEKYREYMREYMQKWRAARDE